MQGVSAPTRSYSSTLCNDSGVYDGVINEEATWPRQLPLIKYTLASKQSQSECLFWSHNIGEVSKDEKKNTVVLGTRLIAGLNRHPKPSSVVQTSTLKMFLSE